MADDQRTRLPGNNEDQAVNLHHRTPTTRLTSARRETRTGRASKPSNENAEVIDRF